MIRAACWAILSGGAALAVTACVDRTDGGGIPGDSSRARAALDSARASFEAVSAGTRISAETTLAGYTVRCYAAGRSAPFLVAVWDGEDPVWHLGARGDTAREMDVDLVASCPVRPRTIQARGTAPPAGTDLTRDGAPDLLVTAGDGMLCDECVGLAVVELTRPLRVHRIAVTDSFAVRDLDHDGVPEITLTDVSMNDLGAATIRPRAMFRYAGGRYRLAEELMRTPAPDSTGLARLAARLSASPDRVPALHDAMARLVAGGNPAHAWKLMEWVLPPSEQAEFAAVFRRTMGRSAIAELLAR